MLATLDYLSGGRIIFGIGSGWDQEEFDYFFSNPNKSPIREKWIDSYEELLKLSRNI